MSSKDRQNLFGGFSLTAKHLTRPRVTRQYP